MKRTLSLLFLLITMSCSTESAQRTDLNSTAVFAWATELCDYQSTFNPGQYTKQQLTHTNALWMDNWYLEAPAVAATPDELPRLDTNNLRRDFERMLTHLHKITPVEVPYWQQLKQQRIRAIKSEYVLKKLAIRAYANPELLRTSIYDSVGSYYVNALTSGDTTALLTAWQQLNEEQKKSSGLPEKLDEVFRQNYNSANRLQIAKVELMAYGWWNHVKPTVPYIARTQQMETEFKKLFSTHKIICTKP